MAPLLVPSVQDLEAERSDLKSQYDEDGLRGRAAVFDLRREEARALRRLDEISFLLGE